MCANKEYLHQGLTDLPKTGRRHILPIHMAKWQLILKAECQIVWVGNKASLLLLDFLGSLVGLYSFFGLFVYFWYQLVVPHQYCCEAKGMQAPHRLQNCVIHRAKVQYRCETQGCMCRLSVSKPGPTASPIIIA